MLTKVFPREKTTVNICQDSTNVILEYFYFMQIVQRIIVLLSQMLQSFQTTIVMQTGESDTNELQH